MADTGSLENYLPLTGHGGSNPSTTANFMTDGVNIPAGFGTSQKIVYVLQAYCGFFRKSLQLDFLAFRLGMRINEIMPDLVALRDKGVITFDSSNVWLNF